MVATDQAANVAELLLSRRQEARIAGHMSDNAYGKLFRVTTWGESHGPALGCVVDGVPPQVPLSAADIQHWLDQRQTASSDFVPQRREPYAAELQIAVLAVCTPRTRVSARCLAGDPHS